MSLLKKVLPTFLGFVMLILPLASVQAADEEVYYFLHDHLGSIEKVLDDQGGIVEERDYLPFGQVRNSTQPPGFSSQSEAYSYTGKELDDETDLYFYGARYYDSEIGRFTSIDPLVLDEASISLSSYINDPQSLNGYSYVRNNPIIFTDPLGEFWWYGFYDWEGYDGLSGVMMKTGEVLGGHTSALATAKKYASVVDDASSKYGVDPDLVNAILYEEQSHLTPDEIFGREQLFPNLGSGGVGVMQVSGPVGKEHGDYSKSELARNPIKNIDSGVSYISDISARQNTTDPVIIGSEYNGASAYGKRIEAQLSNPKYNTNILFDKLGNIASKVGGAVRGLFE